MTSLSNFFHDFFNHLLKNDHILLCSDGLTNMIDDADIKRIILGQRDIVEKAETDAEPVETVIMEDAPEQPVQQTVNNPFVFNFNQYGNNGTQIGHVENYYGGKKKAD